MRIEELDEYLAEDSVLRLRAVVEGREDVIVSLVDEDLRMLWASPLGSRSMFGREQADFEGMPAIDFVHPGDRADFRERYAKVAKGEALSWVVRALDAAGNYQRVRTVVWPVPVGGARSEVAFVSLTMPSTDLGRIHEQGIEVTGELPLATDGSS